MRSSLFGTAALFAVVAVGCSGAEEHPESVYGVGSELPVAAASGGAPSAPELRIGAAGAAQADNSDQAAGGACAAVAQQASPTLRPIDVIFAIDNSASMADEIVEVEQRIDADFARIMQASGLDYRVILVSRYGDVNVPVGKSEHPVCVGAPLGSSDCQHAASAPLINSPRFFQFSADVGSHDAWCVLLGGFSQPDEYGDTPRPGWISRAPGGYSTYLRSEAFKVFVVISDDDVQCKGAGVDFDDRGTADGGKASASLFDQALLRLSPKQFGTAAERNYVWHSIVGLGARADASEAWPASAPIQTSTCGNGSEGAGTGYQALSVLTGGLRYPSCNHQNFDAVFNRIADGIVTDSALSCAWEIPSAPSGEEFDAARVNVRFTPATGVAEALRNVGSQGACDARGGWYYDDPRSPTRVITCPSSCERIRHAAGGRVDVLFGCQTEVVVR